MTDLAVFDFDGTLLPGDSLLPFVAAVIGRRASAAALARHGPYIAAALVGLGDRDEAKRRLLTHAFAGRSFDDIESAARRFTTTLPGKLRADVVARLRWHQASGHGTVIVSASPAVYLRPLGAVLGVDGVIATELETRYGRCTGGLEGRNCRGAEKVARLQKWLGDRSYGRLWVYGDSAGDRELLALADMPERVGRRRLLELPDGAP